MWISDGTVNVTNGSPAIVGVGTSWAGTVRQGWGFYAPDGKLYQVLSVNGNTSITLARNYTGTTVTGAVYDLVPTQGETRALAARLSELIATYAGFITTKLAGLFSAGSVGTPGVAREGDTNTGIYWPADDALAATVGGVEAWRVTSAQNFGLGVPSPVVKFDMGTTGGGRFRVDTSNPAEIIGTASNYAGSLFSTLILDAAAHSLRVGGTEALRIDSSRQVGIGTTIIGGYRVTTGGSSAWITAGANFTIEPNVASGLNGVALKASFSSGGHGPISLWTSDLERMRIDSSGNLGVGTTAPTALLDVNSNTMRLRSPATPASAGTAGDAGTIAWDSNFVYVCVATNTWKRSPLSTW